MSEWDAVFKTMNVKELEWHDSVDVILDSPVNLKYKYFALIERGKVLGIKSCEITKALMAAHAVNPDPNMN